MKLLASKSNYLDVFSGRPRANCRSQDHASERVVALAVRRLGTETETISLSQSALTEW